MVDRLESMEDCIKEQPVVVPLGPVQLETPAGLVMYLDARLCSNGTATSPNGAQVITIMMVLPVNLGEEVGLAGGIAQFTPDEARTFAASLCLVADKVDGRVGMN